MKQNQPSVWHGLNLSPDSLDSEVSHSWHNMHKIKGTLGHSYIPCCSFCLDAFCWQQTEQLPHADSETEAITALPDGNAGIFHADRSSYLHMYYKKTCTQCIKHCGTTWHYRKISCLLKPSIHRITRSSNCIFTVTLKEC